MSERVNKILAEIQAKPASTRQDGSVDAFTSRWPAIAALVLEDDASVGLWRGDSGLQGRITLKAAGLVTFATAGTLEAVLDALNASCDDSGAWRKDRYAGTKKRA